MPDINSFFPSSYLRAADVPQPRVLTMTDVVSETFDDGTSKPCVGFQEITQRLGLNKTNANSIAQHILKRRRLVLIPVRSWATVHRRPKRKCASLKIALIRLPMFRPFLYLRTKRRLW